jgi:UDP-N-acetyl-D-glucosamine dehydrogenase
VEAAHAGNTTARFIELASEINTEMPRYWVQKVQDALNDAGKPVKGSRVLVLGVAYKKNVSDLRESPALDIIHLLEDKGAHVTYHDPHVPCLCARRHGDGGRDRPRPPRWLRPTAR